MNEKTPEEIQEELDQFKAAAEANKIDNPELDPPDVATVADYG